MKHLLLILACVSLAACDSAAPREPVPGPSAPGTWVASYHGEVTTLKNTRTRSCYIIIERRVYGGYSVAVASAQNLGDCE